MRDEVRWSTAFAFLFLAQGSAHAKDTVGGAPAEVWVRGEKSSQARSVPHTLISGARLSAPGLTAADALRLSPGVSVFSSGGYGALSTLSLRGATPAQTPVYFGGIRLNDEVAGTADLSMVPTGLLSQVAIYRGHGPIESDQLGPGGAVFFEPKRPERTEASLGALVGSFGTRGGWGSLSVRTEDIQSVAFLRTDQAENNYAFASDGGLGTGSVQTARRQNADIQNWDLLAMSRARARGAMITVLTNTTLREQGVPGFALVQTEAARERRSRALLSISAKSPCPRPLSCTFELVSTMVVGRTHSTDPLRRLGLGADFSSNEGVRWDERALLWFAPARSFKFAVGSFVTSDHLSVRSREAEDAARRSLRSSALADWSPTTWLTFHGLASGAVEDAAYLQTSSRNAYGTGRVGAQVGAGPLRALVAVGRYNRRPTLVELFGVSGTVRGNPNLEAEVSTSFDAGVVVRKGQLEVESFAFSRETSNLIAFRRSSSGFQIPYNVGKARVLGLETSAAFSPSPLLALELSVTLMDPRDVTETRPQKNDILSYRSRLTMAPRVEFRIPNPLSERKLSTALSYLYQSSRFADPAGLVVLEGQGALDVDLAFPLRSAWTFRARGANLLDERRADLLGYPLPGRAAYASLEATWN